MLLYYEALSAQALQGVLEVIFRIDQDKASLPGSSWRQSDHYAGFMYDWVGESRSHRIEMGYSARYCASEEEARTSSI